MKLNLRRTAPNLLALAIITPLLLTGCTNDKSDRGDEKGISKLEHEKSDRKFDRKGEDRHHRKGPGERPGSGDGTKWTKPAREGGATSDPAKTPAPPTGPVAPAPVEPAPVPAAPAG